MKSFQVVYTEESELTRTFVYRVQAESAEEAEEKVRQAGYQDTDDIECIDSFDDEVLYSSDIDSERTELIDEEDED
jgi:hypothetical protein